MKELLDRRLRIVPLWEKRSEICHQWLSWRTFEFASTGHEKIVHSSIEVIMDMLEKLWMLGYTSVDDSALLTGRPWCKQLGNLLCYRYMNEVALEDLLTMKVLHAGSLQTILPRYFFLTKPSQVVLTRVQDFQPHFVQTMVRSYPDSRYFKEDFTATWSIGIS